MRALRYDGPEKGVTLNRDAAEPTPRIGDAVIRPSRVALGPADIAFERLRPASSGITIGRQFVGVVESVASAAGGKGKHPLVGRRVVATVNVPCGACDLCKRGLSAHCATRAVLGMRGLDGACADRVCIPARQLVAVPDHVDDDAAVFAEPLAASMHAAGQLRLEGKPYITVLGDGVVALLCAQVMARQNASVRLLCKDERRLELAAKWGIKHRPESEAGRRADQDVVIDCTGTNDGLSLALQLVRPRGKVLLKSLLVPATPAPTLFDAARVAMHEIEIIGSRCGPVAEAVALLARGEVDVISLIVAREKLDRGAEALRAAARGDGLATVLEV